MKIKEELIQSTVLMIYNPNTRSQLMPLCMDWKQYFCNREMVSGTQLCVPRELVTEVEQHYAQATVWACEKFSLYILGKRILIETDHKPLIPLLGHKRLDNLPPTFQVKVHVI